MFRLPSALLSLALLPALWAAPLPASAAEEAPAATIEPVLGDDGMYHQTWFLNSFLDLRDDLSESHSQGKRLAVIFEQKGCPYCRDLHTINFADPKTNTYIRERFNIVQINLWGDREVTDFDGETLPEKDFAQKYAVNFTPTILFFPQTVEEVGGKGGQAAEVARMPGYFRPFHFISMFEWVHEKRGDRGQGFQRYILEKANAETGAAAQ